MACKKYDWYLVLIPHFIIIEFMLIRRTASVFVLISNDLIKFYQGDL
ncbi:hypothetical protein EJK48_0541 [Moraxella catarrhalis]|nr:hypothetical protein EJK48_0541 [Moraxella catarrhalis]RUO14599.1 hypothetical protein EJK49_1744 [Moraxella catarrhalis]